MAVKKCSHITDRLVTRKQKSRRKTKIVVNVSQGWSNLCASFWFSKSSVLG